MSTLINYPTLPTSQATFAKSLAPIRAATQKIRPEQNGRLSGDKCRYHKANNHSATDQSLRLIVNLSKLTELLDLDERRRVVRIATCWFARILARARLFSTFAMALRAWAISGHRQAFLRWSSSQFKTLCLPAPKPKIDTSPLVKAAERKAENMVIQIPSADIQPASYGSAVATMPAMDARPFYAGRSPTEGLPQTIDTTGMVEMLYKVTERGDPEDRAKWLIGSSARWNGTH